MIFLALSLMQLSIHLPLNSHPLFGSESTPTTPNEMPDTVTQNKSPSRQVNIVMEEIGIQNAAGYGTKIISNQPSQIPGLRRVAVSLLPLILSSSGHKSNVTDPWYGRIHTDVNQKIAEDTEISDLIIQ